MRGWIRRTAMVAGGLAGAAAVEGARVPMAGEVAWVLPEGELTYWRGRIVKVEYEMGR